MLHEGMFNDHEGVGPLPDRRTEAEFAGDANREWVSYLKVEY